MEHGGDVIRWGQLEAIRDRINLTDNAERADKRGLSLWHGSFNLRFRIVNPGYIELGVGVRKVCDEIHCHVRTGLLRYGEWFQ